jgi:anti-sigma factor RsiW
VTTTPDDHEQRREQLGAYALGQLDANERAEVEDHLGECPACRAEPAAIAPLAAPLGRIPSHDRADDATTEPTVHPTPGGFDAILGRVRKEEQTPVGPAAPVVDLAARRRSRLVAVVAAAVVAVAALGVGYVVGTGSGGPDPEPVAVQALDPTIRASAGTIDHTWGVEMVLTASGFAEGQRYEVTVLDRAGRPVPAGAFRGTGPAEMVCRLNSSVLRDQAGGFVVTDANGDEVLRSRFT